MNTEKEKLLYDTYQSFIDQCLGRIMPDSLNEILSEDAMGFGTTADEKIFGFEDFLKLIRIQKEQSEGLDMNWEIDPVSRYVNSDENLAVFADDLHLTVAVIEEKIKMYLRISVVLECTNNKWIVIHWHGSKPEDVQSEEDTYGIENWKQKVEKLERIVAERTADLVEKNRELEIETSLEKIRAVAMSMMKPDDLLNICQIQFSELTKLGFTEIRNALIEIFNDKNKYFTDYDYSDFSGGTITQIPYHKNPEIDRSIKQMKSATDAFTEFVVKGKELEEWKSFRQKNGEYEDTGLKDITALYYYFYSVKAGSVGISTFKKISEHQLLILKRIRNVFDLAYQRYTDISLAEAQAREAEIELALERVRARTMAMQHSGELADASLLLDQQVRGLGIKTRGCAFNIYGEKESTEWFSNEMGTMQTYKTPREKVFLHYYKAGQKGKTFLTKEFSGKECVDWYNYLCTLPVMGDGLKQMIAAGGSFPTRQIDHVSFFKYGYLLFITFEPVPEAHDIFKRFAKVFEQTYTRFLDLKKAEAQALQAAKNLIEIKMARQKAEKALTHLQAAQKQLVQSEKMASLGELTAGIAHEIQNPLNFVNNFSEVSNELIDEMNEELAKGDFEEAKAIAADVKQNLEKISHHGKRAGDIIKSMLQHSRASTGIKEPTNINALADEYLRLSYHGLRAKDKSFNADFNTDFVENLGKINIIPQDIGRVLLNLYNNAFYAVQQKQKELSGDMEPPYQPTVFVQTKRINDKVEIVVKDNGKGIPQKIADKIFQPFFTTKPTGQGTGLGLSLSYDIIKAHGGEIKVESNEGEGTEFIIHLPIG